MGEWDWMGERGSGLGLLNWLSMPTPTASLLLNVSTLLQEPVGAVRDYHLHTATLDGPLRLLRTDQSLLVSGRLETTAEDICGACLAPLSLSLRLEFDEEFWPAAAPLDGFAVLDGQLDLTEVVRQYVEMARPISPRCAADCPGLGSAQAGGEPQIDDRWAALASLREPQPGRSG